MTDHMTQPTLLARVRDPRDLKAWADFEKKYRDLLLTYASRRGLQPADAEDVRQQVMFNLAKYLRDFQYDASRGRFRSYLGRMVRHAVAQHHSKRMDDAMALDSKMQAVVPGDDDFEADGLWEEEWMNHHYRLAMDTIRGKVDEKTAAVFEQFIAGKSAEEIATVHDMSIGAVQKTKQRMRDRLKEQIARQIKEEDANFQGGQ